MILKNIQSYQEEYLELLNQYQVFIQEDTISIQIICQLLEKIKCFWLERLEVIDYEINEVTKDNICFIMFGDIKLRLFEYNHFYFKTFGDFHFISDPILKMESFFRIANQEKITPYTLNYFEKVFSATLDIISLYPRQFLILPINELVFEFLQIQDKMRDSFFWNFISRICKDSFENSETFCRKFQTFDQIEKCIDKEFSNNLIFNDYRDKKLSLREKLDKLKSGQAKISVFFQDKSEAQFFLISTYSQISQVIDILFVCSTLKTNPYIQNDISLHYLAMIMNIFEEDKYIKGIIENALICFLFYKSINMDKFKKINFETYCACVKKIAPLKVVQGKIREMNIDIFKDDTKKVVSIIDEVFKSIIAEI